MHRMSVSMHLGKGLRCVIMFYVCKLINHSNLRVFYSYITIKYDIETSCITKRKVNVCIQVQAHLADQWVCLMFILLIILNNDCYYNQVYVHVTQSANYIDLCYFTLIDMTAGKIGKTSQIFTNQQNIVCKLFPLYKLKVES